MRGFIGFFVGFLALLLIGAVLLPSTVVIERSATINRPVSTLFTVLNAFSTWPEWSPWAALDPELEWVRSGPDAGVGARLDWTGDPSLVGAGWQKIVRSEPSGLIVLEAEVGLQVPGKLIYRIDGDGLGSRVSWRFEADVVTGQGFANALQGRYFGWFFSRWIASDLERGLSRLEAFVEDIPSVDFAGATLYRAAADGQRAALIDGIEGDRPDQVAAALADAFRTITRWAVARGVELSGQPMTLARALPTGGFSHVAMIPIGTGGAPTLDDSLVRVGTTPKGESACIVHTGSVDDTLTSYARLEAWIAARGEQPSNLSWERYLGATSGIADSAPKTEICVLLEKDG